MSAQTVGSAIVRIIAFLLARRKMLVIVSCAVLALLIAGDALLVDKEHAHTEAEHWPGFWSAFGFVACVLIIIVSKWYGHLGIMTREDYYDR